MRICVKALGSAYNTLSVEVLTHILSHLPPLSLSSITLVSRRFHNLVTTPHAWRIAFSRYFPGPLSLEDPERSSSSDKNDSLLFDRRFFARLTALASWRSEYILRTRLLRSLSRGKPAIIESSKRHDASARSATPRAGSAVATFTSQLLYPISHLGGFFGSKDSKEPLFIHGASEQGVASSSNPSLAKVGTWGLYDYQIFRNFGDLFPGEAEYGLGSGDLVGQPNSMDVSQPFGMIYGEGCPQGRTYYISSNEQRGRFLEVSDSSSQPHLGMPSLNLVTTCTCAVWIAKSINVPKVTDGLIGMMSGSSTGVLSAYSLGPHPVYGKRYGRGQVTAKWVLSPGVPIVSIVVDDNFSPARHGQRRVWGAVLNALGEVFFITDLPRQTDSSTKAEPEDFDKLAWKTGRSVRWELIEPSRRTARHDPFNHELVDGSYSPRSSWDSMDLDDRQLAAETKEIEAFMLLKPKHFRKVCEGWDMQRELQVDFASDDGHAAGESIIVLTRGALPGGSASIRRYTREKLKTAEVPSSVAAETFPRVVDANPPKSIFGGGSGGSSSSVSSLTMPSVHAPSRPSELSSCSIANTEWKVSDFSFAGAKSIRITCSALDNSMFSQLTANEDPLLSKSGESALSSPVPSRMPRMAPSTASSEIPGRRARYMAIGTSMGTIYVWDVRSPTSRGSGMVNAVYPLRIIQTESPQVNCVALTALYLVHGGNDGLVQAWDPLASSKRPIRTMNSRFSSRARRRLVQAEASILGVGSNYFAAGAICLDPDPTVLRGMVSLGTHLRYWSYSSSSADQYKSCKRRLRPRFLNGGNSHPDGQRFNTSGRDSLQDQIEEERREMVHQEVTDRKERAYLNSRFGIGLLGFDASEDDLIAYARLLSEESYTSDVAKRGGEAADSSAGSTSPSDAIGLNDNNSTGQPGELTPPSSLPEENLDRDLAEAIRLSLLQESENENDKVQASSFETSFSGAGNSKDFPGAIAAAPSSQPPDSSAAESSNQQEMDDLELALQLSLVDQQNSGQSAVQHDNFPMLGSEMRQMQTFPYSPAPAMSRSSKKKGKYRAL